MTINREYVREFKKTIKKGPFKEYIFDENCKLSAQTEPEVYQAAIYQGYLDACRTFTSGNTLKKDNRVKDLAVLMKSYIDGFSVFEHNTYCETLIGNGLMTYGQAQKIVNMAFKYLYCLTESSDDSVKEKFKPCHMPLDSIMLDWVYRNILIKDADFKKKSKIGKWSKMSYSGTGDVDKYGHYTYKFYVDKINTYCKENQTPLQLDFENWREMSLILAAEEFIKAFDEKMLEENKDLEYLLKRIGRILDNYK